jgi:outer membrane protein
MVKKNLGWMSLFVLICIPFAFQAFAQQSSKIAIIDSQKTLQNSGEGKKVIAQLQDKEQKIKSELAAMDKDIQDKETKLRTQTLVMTAEAREQMALDLENLKTKRKRTEEDSVKEWQRLQASLFEKIRKELQPIIENIAKEREFSLVLDSAAAQEIVVYFHPAIDITDEVVKRYDASRVTKK